MNELIDNLINGNLKEAKYLAMPHSARRIKDWLIDYGYSKNKATLTADWLKGRDCWQAACDAE